MAKNNESMRLLYVPALLDGIANVTKRCLIEGNRFGLYKGKYDPAWFTDLSLFEHDHFLTSYYYAKKEPNFREKLRVKEGITFWADSGGYTVATKGAKIDPREALKWQEHNSDIAFTLDHPPTIVTAGNRISPGKNERVTTDVFEQHALRTRENNKIFYEERTREDLIIYDVMHGYDIKTFDLWWDYTARDYRFEGFGTGPKPAGDVLLQAMSIMYLWDKGVTERVHLLGVSGITVIPALAWASQYIDKISFDSTSYGYGSLTRAYVYPEKIRYYTHFGNKYNTKEKPIEEMYCTCPVCRDFKDPSYFIGGGSTWPGLLLSLHNLWCVKEYVAELDRIVNVEKDKEKFVQFIYKHTGNWADRTMHAVNFIEDCVKYGFHKAYDLYFQNHDFNKPKYKRKILF